LFGAAVSVRRQPGVAIGRRSAARVLQGCEPFYDAPKRISTPWNRSRFESLSEHIAGAVKRRGPSSQLGRRRKWRRGVLGTIEKVEIRERIFSPCARLLHESGLPLVKVADPAVVQRCNGVEGTETDGGSAPGLSRAGADNDAVAC
jgi:hypothetical protein